MPTTETTTPAIVGAAQVVSRPDDGDLHARAGPIELMMTATRAAGADSGVPALLERVDWLAVVGGWWRFRNPAQLIAERIGARGARTALTAVSGSAAQEAVGVAADRIARGELDVALVVGGEARWTHKRLKAAGDVPTWLTVPGEGEPERLSEFPDEMLAEFQSLGPAATTYAMFEEALRAEHGESVDEHRTRIAELWSRFSHVAADNLFAWDRAAKSPIEVRDEGLANRMISFPYTKAMVANNSVDMASAVLLCSVGAARAAGVSSDRLVFPQAVATSHETWQLVHRDSLCRSTALEAAGRAVFEHTGIGPGDLDHIDLYACFPSIVQMSADALGLDLSRQLTVTGGLGFAGAPVANSAGQAIAAIVPLVRDGGSALVQGNGGNVTKHALGVYGDRPPAQFRLIDAQPTVDLHARPALDETWSGDVEIEASTVEFDRAGPSRLLAAVRSGAARGWATSTDADLMAHTMEHGLAGSAGRRSASGELTDVSN